MDGSRVTQRLEFLWFYTNVLTCTHDPVPSLTRHSSPSSIHANELHHEESQQHAYEDLMSLTTRCLKCGQISSSIFEEDDRVMHGNSGMKSGKETKKRDHRRKWRKKKLDRSSGLNGTEVILGRLDDAEIFNRFLNSYEYDEMIKTTTKLPPFDDDVAMKQHLKSWAYAVACTVK